MSKYAINSYAHGLQLLSELGVRTADNKQLFEYNPYPSVCFKLHDGRGAILHYNLGRGAITVTNSYAVAHSRVAVLSEREMWFNRRRYR